MTTTPLPWQQFSNSAKSSSSSSSTSSTTSSATVWNSVDELLSAATKLGQGNFGRVYQLWHHPSRQWLACKCIEKSSKKRNQRTDVECEVKVLHRLQQSPYCLSWRGSHEDTKRFYVLTEFLQGYTPLDMLCSSVLQDVKQMFGIVAQLVKGLLDIHDKQIAHRDIKPGNIMVSENTTSGVSATCSTLQVRYIDFGLACTAEDSPRYYTIGTDYWMAPEIIHRLARTSYNLELYQAADWFSLGLVCLYIFGMGKVRDIKEWLDQRIAEMYAKKHQKKRRHPRERRKSVNNQESKEEEEKDDDDDDPDAEDEHSKNHGLRRCPARKAKKRTLHIHHEDSYDEDSHEAQHDDEDDDQEQQKKEEEGDVDGEDDGDNVCYAINNRELVNQQQTTFKTLFDPSQRLQKHNIPWQQFIAELGHPVLQQGAVVMTRSRSKNFISNESLNGETHHHHHPHTDDEAQTCTWAATACHTILNALLRKNWKTRRTAKLKPLLTKFLADLHREL